ncbi:MAG: phage tail sheath family protein [Rhodospirillales bacterium]|nr:phage tail sheath family protein [Rhodospirillales bacterium]
MPVTPSYPGLYIEELPSSSHAITAAPTSITAFVGYTHPFQGECAKEGLWGEAIRIFNFTDYERIFGGLYRSTFIDSTVAYAVNQFFLNGGSDAYVVALQPKYFEKANLSQERPIDGATRYLSGIAFTAKQLTDATHNMTVTIGNVRAGGTAGVNDTADILIIYGSQVESLRGVKLGTTGPDFIAKRLASSRLVKVAPQPPGAYPTTFSITGTSQSIELSKMPPPAPGFATVAFTTFRQSDFLEVFQANSSLDKVDIFNLLVVPGVADAGVWSAALGFCERKLAFFILDPPESVSADGSGAAAGLGTIEDVANGNTVPTAVPNGALYFPHLKSIDPVTSKVMELPPSGSVAGIYARTDTKRGVWKAPAGLETSILNTTGVVERGRMTDMRQGTLNRLGVNVLRSFPGSGTVVWGARTTVSARENTAFQQWWYVPVRRTALFIEQSLLRNLGWVVFEPNDEPLWSAIRLSVENFMLSLFRQGAFQGATPSQAFLVKCDKTTTLQTDIDLGIVNILVGFRPLKPAEFVIIKIAQLAGQVQA